MLRRMRYDAPACPMKPRSKILLAAGAALICAGLAAAWWARRLPDFAEDLHREVPGLGQRIRPNLRNVEVVIPGRPHPRPWDASDLAAAQKITRRVAYRCSTNAFGHRNGPVPGRPAAGTTRIICLGGAVTFGHGVDQGRDFPARLQQALAPHGKFEVINAGDPAEHVSMLPPVLSRLIIPLQPRLVIFTLGANEIARVMKGKGSAPIYHPAEYQSVGDFIRRSLRRMISTLKKEKIEVALVIPPMNSFYPFPEHRFAMDEVRALGKELGVAVFDVGPAFRERERRGGLVLKLGGRLYRRQELIAFDAGKARSLLVVETEPVRQQHIDHRIYAYLERHDEAQALNIDGVLPNAAGHQLMAGILARGVLELLKVGSNSR